MNYIKTIDLILDNPANNLTTTSEDLLDTMKIALELDFKKSINNKLTGKELAEVFSDSVNSSNFKVDEFVETFTRQHRTVQQSMFGAILAVVSKVGSDDYGTDARNEQSKSTAKKLLDGYEEESYKELIAQGDSEERARKYAKIFRKHLNSLSFI